MIPATMAARTNATTAVEPIRKTAMPDSEKMPAAIIVPRPMAKAILKSSVRVCSTIDRECTLDSYKSLLFEWP